MIVLVVVIFLHAQMKINSFGSHGKSFEQPEVVDLKQQQANSFQTSCADMLGIPFPHCQEILTMVTHVIFFMDIHDIM